MKGTKDMRKNSVIFLENRMRRGYRKLKITSKPIKYNVKIGVAYSGDNKI
jgi:hypothetical protein